MKKFLLITYYWPPAGGAGVQRWLKMSKYLPEFGIDPIILTIDEKYASYPVTDRSFLKEVPDCLEVFRTKSFEPLQYYSQLVGKKNVPYSGFANVETESFFSQLARWVRGNLFIPDVRKGWNKYAIEAASEIIQKEGIEVVITTGPPHSTHLIGLELKRKYEIKWIADFRDPWTDIYYYDQLLHTKRAKKIDQGLELKVLSLSDVVLTVCPSNHELISAKLPTSLRTKVTLLPNGFDEADFKYIRAIDFDGFTMVYTGTMAASYQFPPLLEALSDLQIDWKLIIAGSISPEVKSQIEKLKIEDRIDFRGYIPHGDVISLLISADLLIHVLPEHEKGTSGKLFEYIGSGKPILNIGREDGDSAFYIREANAGENFANNKDDCIKRFIEDLNDGRIKFKYDNQLFTRKSRAEELVGLINHLK